MKWDYDGTELQDDRNDAQRAGQFPLVINPTHADSANPQMDTIGPYSEQIAAYNYLIDNEVAICQLVLERIAQYFITKWQQYFRDDGASEALIEHVSTPAGIQETLHLNRLSVHNKFFRGSAYIGFGFDCSWEEEHGVGVLLHADRVVSIGGEDTSCDPSAWADSAVVEKVA